jgi:hypothetical protein
VDMQVWLAGARLNARAYTTNCLRALARRP